MLLNSARQLIRYRMSVYKAAKLLVRVNQSARGRDDSPASGPALARPSQLAGTGRRAISIRHAHGWLGPARQGGLSVDGVHELTATRAAIPTMGFTVRFNTPTHTHTHTRQYPNHYRTRDAPPSALADRLCLAGSKAALGGAVALGCN